MSGVYFGLLVLCCVAGAAHAAESTTPKPGGSTTAATTAASTTPAPTTKPPNAMKKPSALEDFAKAIIDLPLGCVETVKDLAEGVEGFFVDVFKDLTSPPKSK